MDPTRDPTAEPWGGHTQWQPCLGLSTRGRSALPKQLPAHGDAAVIWGECSWGLWARLSAGRQVVEMANGVLFCCVLSLFFFLSFFPIPKQPSCVFGSPVNHSSSSGKGGKKHMIQARKHAGRWGELAEDSRAEPCAGTGAATSCRPPPCPGCSGAGTAPGRPGMGGRGAAIPCCYGATGLEVPGGADVRPGSPTLVPSHFRLVEAGR